MKRRHLLQYWFGSHYCRIPIRHLSVEWQRTWSQIQAQPVKQLCNQWKISVLTCIHVILVTNWSVLIAYTWPYQIWDRGQIPRWANEPTINLAYEIMLKSNISYHKILWLVCFLLHHKLSAPECHLFRQSWFSCLVCTRVQLTAFTAAQM